MPTTSSRVRSTSIVALTVSSSRSTSQPAADGRAAGPSNGASVVPISQWSRPRHEEDDLARDADGQPGLVRDPLARDDEVRAAARQDAQRAAAERVVGSAAQTPVASTTALVADLERRRRSSGPRRRAPGSRRTATGPQPGGADPGDRHGAGGDRGPGHGQRVARVVLDAVVVEQPAAQARRGAGSAPSSSVAAFDSRRCQPPSCRAPRMSYSVSPAS